MKLLFVCTGNTCRSPMAEALTNACGEGLCAKSCGCAAAKGKPASQNAKAVMAERGISLEGHSSSPLTRERVDWADAVLCMTEEQAAYTAALFPDAAAKITTVSRYAGGSGDVCDPYGGDAAVYRECARELSGLIDRIARLKSGR